MQEECASTCSGGRLIAGETDMLATRPEPDNISLRMPLIPRRSRVLAPKGDPLAHVERSRINPCMPYKSHLEPEENLWCGILKIKVVSTVYVGVLRDACPPPELLVEMREAAWSTSPWLHSSSNLSGDEANASAIRVKQTEACSNT